MCFELVSVLLFSAHTTEGFFVTYIFSVMSSLNLPAALEDASGGDQLPPSILEKSQAVLSKGGIQAIDTLQRDLPESLERNEQILNEVDTLLVCSCHPR